MDKGGTIIILINFNNVFTDLNTDNQELINIYL